jgi:hypothetical protein
MPIEWLRFIRPSLAAVFAFALRPPRPHAVVIVANHARAPLGSTTARLEPVRVRRLDARRAQQEARSEVAEAAVV